MTDSKIKTIHVVDFNNVETYVKWLNSNRVQKHNYRAFPAKAITLDFSLSRFLKPYHIAPLACLIHEYQINGFKIKISKTNPRIEAYLESFGFDRFCKSTLDTEPEDPKDQKTFPLWLIRDEGKEFYTIKVKEYFENNHFYGHDLFVLGNSLGELLNNIFDHSKSKIPGYTFTQYNTRTSSITTCVCDFGVGIPNSVNRSFLVTFVTILNHENKEGMTTSFLNSSLGNLIDKYGINVLSNIRLVDYTSTIATFVRKYISDIKSLSTF
nr:hypothetical protein [Bacteroidota bacterium]